MIDYFGSGKTKSGKFDAEDYETAISSPQSSTTVLLNELFKVLLVLLLLPVFLVL